MKKQDPLKDNEENEQSFPIAISGTDGKVTMKKNGVGRRFHISKIKEMQSDGWELVK